MPIYEYLCQSCRRRVSLLFRSLSSAVEPGCPRCGSADLKRLVSRVAVLRSEDARLESLADPSAFGDLDESDPRSLARYMRRLSSETGEDLPEEYDEVVDRLEAGESPESIEESVPGLGGEGTGDLGDEDL